MTAIALARSVYETSAKSTGTPRAIEYQVFSQITAALTAAEKNKTKNHPEYIRSLSKNLELWTVLATDMANPDNGLPAELRAQVFYLYEFTLQHTNSLISGNTSLTTGPLVDINNNVMAGLRGNKSRQSR